MISHTLQPSLKQIRARSRLVRDSLVGPQSEGLGARPERPLAPLVRGTDSRDCRSPRPIDLGGPFETNIGMNSFIKERK